MPNILPPSQIHQVPTPDVGAAYTKVRAFKSVFPSARCSSLTVSFIAIYHTKRIADLRQEPTPPPPPWQLAKMLNNLSSACCPKTCYWFRQTCRTINHGLSPDGRPGAVRVHFIRILLRSEDFSPLCFQTYGNHFHAKQRDSVWGGNASWAKALLLAFITCVLKRKYSRLCWGPPSLSETAKLFRT